MQCELVRGVNGDGNLKVTTRRGKCVRRVLKYDVGREWKRRKKKRLLGQHRNQRDKLKVSYNSLVIQVMSQHAMPTFTNARAHTHTHTHTRTHARTHACKQTHRHTNHTVIHLFSANHCGHAAATTAPATVFNEREWARERKDDGGWGTQRDKENSTIKWESSLCGRKESKHHWARESDGNSLGTITWK